MNLKVEKALQKHEAAARNLIRAVQKAYPKGTALVVRKGRNELPLRVYDHRDSWWHDPGYILGENVRTGKTHAFHPTAIVGNSVVQRGES